MATPTTLNIGEPADERSVDGNSAPVGDTSAHGSQGGDQEPSYDDIKRLGPEVFDDVLSPDKADLEMDSMEYDDDIDDDSVADPAEKKKALWLSIFPDCLITPSDVCFKISPAIGAVSYGYFSLSVMEPKWFSRSVFRCKYFIPFNFCLLFVFEDLGVCVCIPHASSSSSSICATI